MSDIYLHGVETIESTVGPRPVVKIDTGVIGLIGTAPDANATLFPLNTPVAIYGVNGEVQGLGVNGTLPMAIEGIFDQAGKVSHTIVVVRVEPGANADATITNMLGNMASRTGVHAFRTAPSLLGLTPKILIAPGFTSQRPTNGIRTVTVSTPGVGYTSAPTVTITGTGTGATASAIINSTTGQVTSVVVTNPGTGYTGSPTVAFSGGGATTQATGTVTAGTVANPVAMALLSLAASFRAIVVKDGPATTTAAAITDRADFNTDRLYTVEPMVQVFRNGAVVNEPASARVAGMIATMDYTDGFWHSPSNKVVQNIVGVSRPIEHSISDPSAESQQLNKNDIAVITRSSSGGFKLWGVRVPSSDTLRKFLSVRRAHDTIITGIELAAEPFLDAPFSVQVLVDIAETVNSALRRWQALGATLGSRVWLDPTLNTKESWASGQLYVSYDAEAPAPIEQITFMFNRNTGYYENLSEAAIREITRLAARPLA